MTAVKNIVFRNVCFRGTRESERERDRQRGVGMVHCMIEHKMEYRELHAIK